MNQRLIIGNRVIRLSAIGSTNAYLKELIAANEYELEGTVVTTDNQTNGLGQRGNVWETEEGKNLTFSVLLNPNMSIDSQFYISKVVALSITNFLASLNIEAKIKWPNDIYIEDDKVGGILIENVVKGGMVVKSVVGIGLNVNQVSFNKSFLNPSSLKLKTNNTYDLNELLDQLLNYLDSFYLNFKAKKNANIDEQYLQNLYRINQSANFEINGSKVNATIIGVSNNGMLQLKIKNDIQLFDLKEVKFLF